MGNLTNFLSFKDQFLADICKISSFQILNHRDLQRYIILNRISFLLPYLKYILTQTNKFQNFLQQNHIMLH
jgi:hypothetical protein